MACNGFASPHWVSKRQHTCVWLSWYCFFFLWSTGLKIWWPHWWNDFTCLWCWHNSRLEMWLCLGWIRGYVSACFSGAWRGCLQFSFSSTNLQGQRIPQEKLPLAYRFYDEVHRDSSPRLLLPLVCSDCWVQMTQVSLTKPSCVQ